MKIHDVFAAIATERSRQEDLKAAGRFAHTLSDPIDRHRKLTILTEEVGEVARALCDRSPDEELRAELIQVAALAVAWLEGMTT